MNEKTDKLARNGAKQNALECKKRPKTREWGERESGVSERGRERVG